MTAKTSTERSRRVRAAAKLGMVWVQGYVDYPHVDVIEVIIQDCAKRIDDEVGK